MGQVKINRGYVSANNKNIESLSDALAAEAKCGCGIDCECFGYVTLPNWVSATGEREDGYAIYIVDGVLTVNTVAVAQSEINAYKVLSA
jgi:hypothetical protein